MTDFFSNNIIGVFFFYGLAFYSMGLAVLLEISHSSELDFAQALKPLAGFGLVHGLHEWFEMGLLFHARLTGEVDPNWVYYLRLVLLGVSFLFLIAFGARMIIGPGKPRLIWGMLIVAIILWGLGLLLIFNTQVPSRSQLVAADVYTRYALAIPGATLTAWGLILQARTFTKAGMRTFSLDVTLAAIAFALYGGIGQLFAAPSIIFPSVYLNSEAFLRWVGFPVQGFRALMAIMAAIFIIRSLRAIDEANRRKIQALSDAQRAEQSRLQALRAELLHRTVQAQEQERQRIARELHDETGQTLTAIGLGLNGLAQNISVNPQRAIQQAKHLQDIATDGLSDLQNLVSGLRPPQLDELGLLPALRWFAEETSNRSKVEIIINGPVDKIAINDEVRLTIYRITQEAITNSVRHAQCSKITVDIEESETEIDLIIHDDGQGFDVKTVLGGNEVNCLGLLGMIERAKLAGGDCWIESEIGKGTFVRVKFKHAKNSESPNQPVAG
jgi:signal transduction histidine kinase